MAGRKYKTSWWILPENAKIASVFLPVVAQKILCGGKLRKKEEE